MINTFDSKQNSMNAILSIVTNFSGSQEQREREKKAERKRIKSGLAACTVHMQSTFDVVLRNGTLLSAEQSEKYKE